ncbi:MFS general substrate transporter [Pleurotus eryngii]|uniref:MFS general substrate transporter n=1 Tax=Pleurotus eryngii TaxID=5323 RepID=A0A9P6DEC3_PLEER|nr:MFS general substrate transporter [Pleurotus eryngii]
MASEKESQNSQAQETHSIPTDYDKKQDKKLIRKVDLRLIPILTLLYLLSFLDRTNIGNARIIGLAADLNVSPPAYNTSLALYFIAYVVFEVPANIVLKRFDPQIWLPTLTLLWGIVSVCQGLVTNQAGLFGIRVLLGVTEAGLFPGVIYVFSVYYRRSERSWRVAIFFGGAALAGAFGGILAYAIAKMIFIIEGLLTVAISFVAYFLVPTWSYNAKFLTDSEREHLLERLRADSDAADNEKFEWYYVRQAWTDHLCWAYALLFHGFAFVLYSLSLFLPTIIAGLGFQSWQAQLLTIPPNALASLAIWFIVWVSSRYNLRAPFIIGAAFVAIIGYIILLTAKTPGGQYVGVHFAAAGVYTGNALLLSWPSENVSGQTKRAIAVATQITIGDIGAVAGVLIYRPNFSGHHFRKPHIISIGYLVFAAAVAAYLWIWKARENARRDEVLRKLADEKEVKQEVNRRTGDRDIYYRYHV